MWDQTYHLINLFQNLKNKNIHKKNSSFCRCSGGIKVTTCTISSKCSGKRASTKCSSVCSPNNVFFRRAAHSNKVQVFRTVHSVLFQLICLCQFPSFLSFNFPFPFVGGFLLSLIVAVSHLLRCTKNGLPCWRFSLGVWLCCLLFRPLPYCAAMSVCTWDTAMYSCFGSLSVAPCVRMCSGFF